MKRLRENTKKVGASQVEVYRPRPSNDVAVRGEKIREISYEQYNMINGAIQLIFSNTFKPEYYVSFDEEMRKEPHERLKAGEVTDWFDIADMSNGESNGDESSSERSALSVLNQDGILLTRDNVNNNIIRLTIRERSTDIIRSKAPGRSEEILDEKGNSLLAKQKLGKLEVQYDSRFLRVNPRNNLLYFNGAPSLAMEVEVSDQKSGKSFVCVGLPSFAIKLETDERGIQKYLIRHLGYYNLDVMMKNALEKTISLIGYFGKDMPTVEELRNTYVNADGDRSAQRMLIEKFLHKIGVTLPKDLKGMLDTAMSGGSYKFITEVPKEKTEPERVKIFTDMLVREAIEKQIKSKEVLFTEFLLNPELVAKVLENNGNLVQKCSESRKEGSNKFDWVIPLSDRQKKVLSTFVEACRVATKSGFDKGLLTLSQLLDNQESRSSQRLEKVVGALQRAEFLDGIKSELAAGKSVEAIVGSRLEKFREELLGCLPSSKTLRDQIAEKFACRLHDFVEAVASEDDQGLILQSFIADYFASMTPVLVTSFIEDSYALDDRQPVLKGKDVEIRKLIAKGMDVPPEAVELANLYYNESHKILRDIGYVEYSRMADKFADKSQQTKTTSFQERGYGAVDSQSNPYDKLEESEHATTKYKIEQDADGKLFVMVDGKKAEITPEQAEALQSLPSADVDGVTELPNSAKDVNKSANRKRERRKQKEEAVGDE
jgi:hypothetical protein